MLNQSTLLHDLRALGVVEGCVIMMHASMRKLGPVAGGASDVVNAVHDAVGPQGTVLMVIGADDDEPFDATTTPVDIADMGVLAEVFRKTPGVKVNDHAADRFAALGALADYLLHPSPLHDYHGPGSVLQRLVAASGFVLRLGAHDDRTTLTHYAEYLSDIPNKRRVRRRYVRADSGEQWIDSLDDSDGIAHWKHGDYFPQILRDYLNLGEASIGPVGNCTAELFSVVAFVGFATDWINRHLVAEQRCDVGESPL
jgi:aminoglycoside N3'-acetyltransferase